MTELTNDGIHVTKTAAASQGMPPRVSVVIPCYDYAAYLEETIDSVVAQTYRDFEIVIVDDGSTDDTPQVCSALLSKHADQRITVLRQPNSGQPAISRNVGIAHSRGEYILPLDGDDKIASDMLLECVTLLDNSPIDIAYTDRRDFGDVEGIVQAGNYDFSKLRYGNQISHCALYPKRVWEKVGGYRTNVRGCEDWDFWVAAGALGFHGKRIPKPLFWYRRKSTGVYQGVLDNPSWYLARIVLNNVDSYEQQARDWARSIHAKAGSGPNDPTPTSKAAPTTLTAVQAVMKRTPRQKAVSTTAPRDNHVATAPAVAAPTPAAIAMTPAELGTPPRSQPPRQPDSTKTPTMLAEPPLVTIVVPTFNRPDRLRKSLQSVLTQTHENLEVLVVSDGGQGVEAVVRELDPSGRTQYVGLGTNRGLPGARNAGLRLARGKYVGFLDDDDWFDPHHVETLVTELERGTHKVAYANSRRIIEVERDGKMVTKSIDDPCAAWCEPYNADMMLVHNPRPVQSVLFLRECLSKVGYLDETLPVLEDWEFWLRMSREFPFKHVPVTTSSVSWRADGMTTTKRRDFFVAACRIQKRYAKHVTDRPDIQRAQAALRVSHEKSSRARPSCSIIIPTGDCSDEVVHRCVLAVLGRTRGISCEYIVTSTHKAPAMGDAPELKWITIPAGTDFRDTVNRVSAHATGRYLVIIEPHAIPRLGWLRPLVECADADNNVAVVGPQLIDASGRIAHIGMEMSRAGDKRQLFVGTPAHSAAATQLNEVDAIAGGVALIRAGDYGAVGGFAEAPTVQDAIADLCVRLRGRNKLVCVAARSVFTWTGGTTELDSKNLAFTHRQAMGDGDSENNTIRELLKTGHLDEAEIATKALLEQRPECGDAWLLHGVISMQRQKPRVAIDAFARAAARGAEPQPSHLGAVMALLGAEQVDEAWRRLEPLCERYSDDTKVIHQLFVAGAALERWKPLAERLERYLHLVDGDHDKRFALASVYVRIGDADNARRHAAIVADAEPTFDGLELLLTKIRELGGAAARKSPALSPQPLAL